jgi:hypothetical protein
VTGSEDEHENENDWGTIASKEKGADEDQIFSLSNNRFHSSIVIVLDSVIAG